MQYRRIVTFKNIGELEDLNYIHPNLLLLFSYISTFCFERGIKFVVTSIIRSEKEDKRLKAKSRTHQGRAFDFSVRSVHGWTQIDIDELKESLEHLVTTKKIDGIPNPFYNIGAISAKTMKQRVILVHNNQNGEGVHAHVQVRRTSEWNDHMGR